MLQYFKLPVFIIYSGRDTIPSFATSKGQCFPLFTTLSSARSFCEEVPAIKEVANIRAITRMPEFNSIMAFMSQQCEIFAIDPVDTNPQHVSRFGEIGPINPDLN